jgi:hypothetical protein
VHCELPELVELDAVGGGVPDHDEVADPVEESDHVAGAQDAAFERLGPGGKEAAVGAHGLLPLVRCLTAGKRAA